MPRQLQQVRIANEGNLNCYCFDSRADASFGYGVALWLQFIIGTVLHAILALEMDDIGALFGLFLGMATDLYQGFDNPFECIDFIIPYNKAAWLFVTRHYIRFQGKYAVKEGSYEELKPMCDAITDRGIGATVEVLA